MAFNSLTFLCFFALFYILYLLLQKRLRWQNLLLLAACYVFYGWGGWQMLSLIGLITLLDYAIGLGLGRLDGSGDRTSVAPQVRHAPQAQSWRRLLLLVSLAANLGLLGVFKYFNFFAGSAAQALSLFGLEAGPLTLEVALPLGISFFTLKSMSYTIDVFQRRMPPTRSLLEYAIFVAFFPALLAGPMDRARHLLPQIAQPRRPRPEQLAAGWYLILWGFYKKLVIADNLAKVVDPVFQAPGDHAGLDILLAVLAFGVQIYSDFSGYSDIARGLAKLMGFELTVNFRLPFFALNPTDFWQRWHISFSEWLRDYIFFPLRRSLLKSKVGFLPELLPPLLTMLFSGLWHGAGWTFLLWGGYHGLLMILYRFLEKRPIHQDPWRSQAYPLVAARMLLMFALVTLGWLFFRASSLEQIGYLLTHLSLATSAQSLIIATDLLLFSAPLLVMEVAQYASGNLLVVLRLPTLLRVFLYALLLALLVVFGTHQANQFIYAQF